MGILNQQLIQAGNENITAAKIQPFTTKENESADRGFGGYTYSKDEEQQEIFNYGSPLKRQGPLNQGILNEGRHQYGPIGMARLSSVSNNTTILGQLAEMLKPEAEGERTRTWSTGEGGQSMARSFTTGNGTRSLYDKTTNGLGNPNSSGGAVAGYSANSEYGINNWNADGSAGTIAQEAVDEVRVDATGEEQMKNKSDRGRLDMGTDKRGDEEVVLVEASAAVEGVLGETFTPTIVQAGGLANLPAFNG